MNKNETHLQIGVITRPHGVRGELKLKLHNESSTALDEAESIIVEKPNGQAARYVIESLRGNAKGLILALENVNGRDEADALRGATIWIERAVLPALEEGEYYLVDLVGCELYFEERLLGKIDGIRPDPTVDTMVVALENGKRAELPIIDAWMGPVDTSRRRVELTSLDGLIEE